MVFWGGLTNSLEKKTSKRHRRKGSSVQLSCSVVSDSLWPHGLQCTRPPCPSPTPGVHPYSCPLSQWCHQAISSSVALFSFFLWGFASGCWGSCPPSLILKVEETWPLESLTLDSLLPFLLCLLLVFFSRLFVRPPQKTILHFCISFS